MAIDPFNDPSAPGFGPAREAEPTLPITEWRYGTWTVDLWQQQPEGGFRVTTTDDCRFLQISASASIVGSIDVWSAPLVLEIRTEDAALLAMRLTSELQR